MSSNCRYRFTLIELVVSIALLIVIATITAMSGAAFYNGYQRSLRETDRLKEYMAIDNLMDTHIRNLIPFNWKDEDGTSRLIFNGEEERLFFTTLRRSYGDRPGALLFIRIFVENEELIAEYSPYPRLPWIEENDDAMPWTREVIARNVSAITFAYAENSAETEGTIEFLETYLEEENSSPPLAIKLTVEWLDGRREQWLRRVAGTSANSTFGVRTPSDQTGSSGTSQASSESAQNQSSSGGSRQNSTVQGGGRRNPGNVSRPDRNSGNPGRTGGGRQR